MGSDSELETDAEWLRRCVRRIVFEKENKHAERAVEREGTEEERKPPSAKQEERAMLQSSSDTTRREPVADVERVVLRMRGDPCATFVKLQLEQAAAKLSELEREASAATTGASLLVKLADVSAANALKKKRRTLKRAARVVRDNISKMLHPLCIRYLTVREDQLSFLGAHSSEGHVRSGILRATEELLERIRFKIIAFMEEMIEYVNSEIKEDEEQSSESIRDSVKVQVALSTADNTQQS